MRTVTLPVRALSRFQCVRFHSCCCTHFHVSGARNSTFLTNIYQWIPHKPHFHVPGAYISTFLVCAFPRFRYTHFHVFGVRVVIFRCTHFHVSGVCAFTFLTTLQPSFMNASHFCVFGVHASVFSAHASTLLNGCALMFSVHAFSRWWCGRLHVSGACAFMFSVCALSRGTTKILGLVGA